MRRKRMERRDPASASRAHPQVEEDEVAAGGSLMLALSESCGRPMRFVRSVRRSRSRLHSTIAEVAPAAPEAGVVDSVAVAVDREAVVAGREVEVAAPEVEVVEAVVVGAGADQPMFVSVKYQCFDRCMLLCYCSV